MQIHTNIQSDALYLSLIKIIETKFCSDLKNNYEKIINM